MTLTSYSQTQMGSLTIFDDGVARPQVLTGSYPFVSYDTVAWGANANTLYGSMTQSSGGPEYIFSVNQNGPTVSQTIPSAFSGGPGRLEYDNTAGLLYDGFGGVVTAATGASAGRINVQNPIYSPLAFAIDPAQGKAFYLGNNVVGGGFGNTYPDIQAFNLNRLSFLGSISVPGLSGSRILPWGTSGLAIGGGSQIFLIDGAFVSPTGVSSPIGGYVGSSPTLTAISPQTVTAGSGVVNVILTGSNFTQAAMVTWNGQTLPSTRQSVTQLTATIPASMLTQAMAAPFYVYNGPGTENSGGLVFTVLPDLGPTTQIAALDISGQDMVWDSTRKLLYVAVTDSRAVNGDSIAVVDPASASLQNVVYTGNQPGALGISDDNVYLYAGFQTSAVVKRFALTDFSLNLTIPLTAGGVSESFAGDVKVAPGQNQTIAVSMGNKSISPRDAGGVAIFDNATQRPAMVPYNGGDMYQLAWGSNSTKLYAQSDPIGQPQSISILSIDNTGVAARVASPLSLTDIGLRPHYDPGTNLIYSDDGRITNPADGSAAGILEYGNLMVPDSTLNRAFVLRQGSAAGSYLLDIYNLQQQTYLKSIPILGVTGYPTQMVRWGTEGIAFLTDSQTPSTGVLYLLQGSDISGLSTAPPGALVLSPANVVVGSLPATITVTGSGFLPTSTVLVDGTARATTYVSATQLTFQLTGTDQAFANYLTVVVSNSGTGGSTSPATSLTVDNPAPSITSLSSPIRLLNSANQHDHDLRKRVCRHIGCFIQCTVRTTTYVSPTQLTVALLSSDLATAGKFPVTIANSAPGGGTSVASTFEVDNYAPVISAVNPSVVASGSAAMSVTLTGTGFYSGTVSQVNGTPRTTSYFTSTQVSVALTAADFSSAGTLSFVAMNAAPGGGTSAAVSLAVKSGLPGPITLSPAVIVQGTSVPTAVMVIGSNFLPGSIVQVSGTSRTTTYVNSTQLTFVLTVADQANAATLFVTEVNPAPTGGTSSAFLSVAAPTATPVISSVSPTQLIANSGGGYLTVSGSGFTANSVIYWNGTALNTSFSSSGYLSGYVTGGLLAGAGTASITVSSPTANPSVSNAATVSIVNPPAPTLTSMSPTFGPIRTGFTATLTGNNFTIGTTVAANGIAIQTTFVSPTQLTAVVPATDVDPGNITFTVTTPAPGGGTSAGLVYTAYIPIANNSMVYNPTNQLFYLSVPSSAGAPYGNSIVSLDPVTGAIGTPIFVGSEPNQLALTSDGKYLWVGLDGASAVRQINLTTGTAGLQFPLPFSSNYNAPVKVFALAALPGQDNSVVVAAGNFYSNSSLTIFDNGVPRGNSLPTFVFSLQCNGSTNEVYGTSSGGYYTFTYRSSGLTPNISTAPAGLLAAGPGDRTQLSSGFMFTDYSSILNAETGTVAGAFSSITNVSTPTAIDAALDLAFVLNSPVQYSQLPNQIQIFNLSNFTPGTSVIPVNVATSNYYSPVGNLSEMYRWGANGLAFRNSVSVYSLRSNLVKDLSTTSADIAITLTSSGPNTTGTQTNYVVTISNAGPANGSEVALKIFPPSTGVLASATSSAGTCVTGSNATCDLGSLNSGGTATVTLVVTQLTPGTATMAVQVAASQADPNTANNQAALTATISGSTFTLVPTLSSVNPATILAGSNSAPITVSGSGFGSGSSVLLDGVPLPTNLASTTQLIATVPATDLTTLGWHKVTVSNPSPGGGVSGALPLSVYTAISAGVNHILYDPFSRQIFATLGSSTALGNSIEALDPAPGTFSTPVPIGSEPTRMALSDDGQMLYTLLSGSNQIIQYKVLAKQRGISFAVAPQTGSTLNTSVGLAVQSGSEDTIAVSQFNPQLEIIDFNSVTQTALARSANAGYTPSANPRFLNPSTVLVAGSSSTLQDYTVVPSGLSSLNASTSSALVSEIGPFQVVNGIAFTSNGAVVDATTQPATQLGSFAVSFANNEASVAPDPTSGRVFFLAGLNGGTYISSGLSGIVAFDSNTYQPAAFLPLDIASIDGTTSSKPMDVIRWGQDGLAALTSSGTIYLLRGAAVVPQLLQSNAPSVLVSSTLTTIQHGSGNTVLILSGTNFVPGVAVLWNGAYRTTGFVSATQVTVDIPAADLSSSSTASIVAINPGSVSSAAITLAIN